MNSRLYYLREISGAKMCSHCANGDEYYVWCAYCGTVKSTEKLAQLRAENKCLAYHLQNLLAVIHRDGGQYTEEHGLETAVEDAHKTWGKLRSQLEKADRLFESISCLCAEGPEFMTEREVIDHVQKKTLAWHNFKKTVEKI